jgi:hypothetical protein
LLLGLCLLLGAASLAVAPAPAVAAEKTQQISRSIAKEMQAVQKAQQANQWADALKNLEAAEAHSGLTPFDLKTIYYYKGFANVKLNQLKAAQAAFEKAIATGAATSEEVSGITRTLFSIAASTQQYAKAVEYGKTISDAGGANVTDLSIIAQSYYLLKDCNNSVVWSDKAIAAARKAGEAPKESVYQFKLQCAFDGGDTPKTIAVLEDLVRLTGKTTYWNSLLRLQRQDEKEDRNLLMIYRIMYNTNSMNAASDYMEMAQLLGDAALPGEAQVVLEKAVSSGLIKDDQKDRTNRLLNAMKTRADVDRKGLPKFDAEASKNPAGELDVKLGEVYYGFGDYPNALTALTRGFMKGQIKHLDEAYVYLGLTQGALKNSAEARKALLALKTVPNMSPRIIKLWALYADREV